MTDLLAHDLSEDSGVERTEDVKSEVIQDRPVTFSDLHLPEWLLKGMTAAGFLRPSPVQMKSIPSARLGLDLLIQAKSGTGKTLVFVIAALCGIDPKNVSGLQALIVAPTREIAVQAARVALDVGAGMADLKVHTFIGGMDLKDDVQKLKKCHIATGTPGRLKQLISEGYMKPAGIRLFVLDEADKLMDSSFKDDITWIFNNIPVSKQVIAASATYPEELAEVVEKYMKNPQHIRLAKEDQVLFGISQFALKVKKHAQVKHQVKIKTGALFHVLNTIPFNQCLVFSNYALRAESLCKLAEERGWPALHIAATKDQRERLQAIRRLKDFQIRVLFSTDLTARGIDAQNVNLVINFDVPWESATYLHRIGRAGRFGTRALAITIASEGEEFDSLRNIIFETGSKVRILPDAKQELPENFDPWHPEQFSMELIEGLEPVKKSRHNGSDSDGKKTANKTKTKQRNNIMKPVVGEEQEVLVEPSNISWIPVSRQEEKLEHHEMPRKEDELCLKTNDSSNDVSEKTHRHNKTLAKYVKRVEAKVNELRNQVEPMTIEDVDQKTEEYMNKIRSGIDITKGPQTEFDLRSNIVTMSKEEKKAFRKVNAQESEEFSQKLGHIDKLLENVDLKDALSLLDKGKDMSDLEKVEPGSEENKPQSVNNTITEDEIKAAIYQQDIWDCYGDMLQMSEFSSPPFNQLPYPNPQRWVPDRSSTNSDYFYSDWLNQWYREVKANSEFIHDMELLTRMKQK